MHGRLLLLANATCAVLGVRARSLSSSPEDTDPVRMEQVPRERRLMHGQQLACIQLQQEHQQTRVPLGLGASCWVGKLKGQ